MSEDVGQKRPLDGEGESSKRQKVEDAESFCVLAGVPDEAEDEDIECWFEGFELAEAGVKRINGKWQVAFKSKEEAQRALEKDGQLMGSAKIGLTIRKPPPALPTVDRILALSVKELRDTFDEHNLSYDDCFEKSELQAKLCRHIELAAVNVAAVAPPEAGQKDEAMEEKENTTTIDDAVVKSLAAIPESKEAVAEPAAVAEPVPDTTPTLTERPQDGGPATEAEKGGAAGPGKCEAKAAGEAQVEEAPKTVSIPKLDLKQEDIPDAPLGNTPKPPSISVQGDLSDTLKGHTMWVAALALTSDCLRLVSGSADQSVKVWCMQTHKELVKYAGHKGKVQALCLTADDKAVVSVSGDKMVHVWELDTGKPLRAWNGKTTLNGVCVAPDASTVVTAGDDKCLRIWDFQTGTLKHNLKGHTGPVWCVTISADGTTLYSGGGDNTIRMWDHTTGKAAGNLTGHTGWVRTLALSSDGSRLVSGGADKTVRVWDLKEKALLATANKHTGVVFQLQIAPSGSFFVSCGEDNTVRLWKTAGCELLNTFKGHVGVVRCVTINYSGGNVISGGGDQTIRFWTIPAELTAGC